MSSERAWDLWESTRYEDDDDEDTYYVWDELESEEPAYSSNHDN